MKDVLYIVMPAYNEELNIEKTVREWYSKLEVAADESRLVIADSGSIDRTHTILARLKEEYPRLIVISDTDRNHGPKLIALYEYAIQNGANYIFQTDSDGQTNPDEFDAFWNLRAQYDVIIGNRIDRKDGFSRKMVSLVLRLILYCFFGVMPPDVNTPYRLMKSEIIDKYLNRFDREYFLPNVMLTAFFEYYHENITFVPISFCVRKAGKNSINIKRIISIGFKSLKDFYCFRLAMKV